MNKKIPCIFAGDTEMEGREPFVLIMGFVGVRVGVV